MLLHRLFINDQVNKDADQGKSEEESEGKYQTERSKKDGLESDISEPDERDQREKNVLFKSTKTPTKGDKDDLVDTDNDQNTNNEESGGKDQREEIKKDNLESDHSETDERDQIENEELVIRKETQKEKDGDDLVNTDTDQSETDERD